MKSKTEKRKLTKGQEWKIVAIKLDLDIFGQVTGTEAPVWNDLTRLFVP